MEMINKKITVLSTFARDILIDERKNSRKEQSGGPALFIKKALEKQNVSFEIIAPPEIKVEILINDSGEFGRIPDRGVPMTVNFKKLNSQFMIISTLLNDFDLENLDEYNGKVFIDIQGYVRDGNDFGKKKKWEPSEEIKQKIYGLKGTSEELNYVDADFLEKQKQKILIKTMGKDGAKIFYLGKEYKIKPRQVVVAKDTIGAGDTFFSYFVTKFIEMNDVVISGEYAAEQVVRFLSEKRALSS